MTNYWDYPVLFIWLCLAYIFIKSDIFEKGVFTHKLIPFMPGISEKATTLTDLPEIEAIKQDFLDYYTRTIVSTSPEDKQDSGTELIERNAVIYYVHNVAAHKNIYISDNFETITGYSCQRSLNEANFIFKIILPEDLVKLFSAAKLALNYIMSLPIDDRIGCRMELNYRIQKPDHSIVSMTDVLTVKELDKEGKISIGSGYMTDVSYLKLDNQINFRVVTPMGNIYSVDSAHPISFSKREREILQLIDSGLSSKEIADRLKLSINTIHNHRSNMMHRNGVRNMIEVLRIAKEKHLIG